MPRQRPPKKKPAPAKSKAGPRITVSHRSQKRSAPPPIPEDAVEVSGIYGRVLFSESDPYAEVREIFNHYDRDGSGQIEAREFARICDALGVELEEEELAAGLSIVDSDGDGRISWDEFLGWWRAR